MESESLAFDPAMFGMKSNHGALLPSKNKNSESTAKTAQGDAGAHDLSSGSGRGRKDGQQRGRASNTQRYRGGGRGRGRSQHRDLDHQAGRPWKRQREEEPNQDAGWPSAEDRIAKAAEPRPSPKIAASKAIDGKKYFKHSMLENPWKDLS